MSSKKASMNTAKLAFTHRVDASTTDAAIYQFLSALDTPKALSVWLLFSNNEHDQLVELETLPDQYIDPVKFRDDYLATQFLSKADFLTIGVSKKEAAMRKFHKYEELCGQTNSRFRNIFLDPSHKGSNGWLLHATRRKIEMILGDFSPEEFVDSANWGPGVTTSLKGEDVSAINKFQCQTGITRDLHALVSPWFSEAYPLWHEHLLTLEQSSEFGYFTMEKGNSIVTVPKNSKTDRVIAVEPPLNLWFQKAVGKMIRRRLRRNGVDLNDQTGNQYLASYSARNGSLATVDFSSASDSISTNVVRELLPHHWFSLMDATRSKIGIDGKETLKWNKFSSMGNGFTFELESLIFYAAALAAADFEDCSSDLVNVFGDDVIIPTPCFHLFATFCDFLGFKVNYQKSFFSGSFRESCGSHYMAALDCKPLFLKRRLHNVHSIYKLANSIRLAAHRYHSSDSCDRRFESVWRYLFRRVPKHFRFVVPSGLGDVGFIGNFDEATPALAGDKRGLEGFEGYLVRCLSEVGVTRQSEGTGVLLARLWSGSEREYGNSYTLRGRTRLKILSVLVPSWCNLGSWV